MTLMLRVLDSQVGMGAPEITVPIVTALVKELTIKGSFRYGVSTFLESLGLRLSQ